MIVPKTQIITTINSDGTYTSTSGPVPLIPNPIPSLLMFLAICCFLIYMLASIATEEGYSGAGSSAGSGITASGIYSDPYERQSFHPDEASTSRNDIPETQLSEMTMNISGTQNPELYPNNRNLSSSQERTSMQAEGSSPKDARIFPDANTRLLTEEEILHAICCSTASPNKLLGQIETDIKAGKGDSFEYNQGLRNYYELFPFYQSLEKHTLSASEYTAIELANLELINSMKA